jgi:hypothetical protein
VLVQSTLVAERHHAINQRKQAVIATTADIAASVEFGTALAHDDRASSDGLAAESLDAEHLRFRVATVARGAAAFFLCHGVLLLVQLFSVDGRDFYLSEVLAMALAFLIVFAAAHFENANFFATAMSHDLSHDRSTRYERRANYQICTVTNGQNFGEGDITTHIRSDLFYFQFIASGNAILLATSFYDCVHEEIPNLNLCANPFGTKSRRL